MIAVETKNANTYNGDQVADLHIDRLIPTENEAAGTADQRRDEAEMADESRPFNATEWRVSTIPATTRLVIDKPEQRRFEYKLNGEPIVYHFSSGTLWVHNHDRANHTATPITLNMAQAAGLLRALVVMGYLRTREAAEVIADLESQIAKSHEII